MLGSLTGPLTLTEPGCVLRILLYIALHAATAYLPDLTQFNPLHPRDEQTGVQTITRPWYTECLQSVECLTELILPGPVQLCAT